MSTSQPSRAQPIPLERKLCFIAEYQANGGNMSAAMRCVGIASRRTAYFWWHRYLEGGENALHLRSHRRKTPGQATEDVVTLVCALKLRNPTWGRRRIAQSVNEQLARTAIGASGVEGILRRRNLWMATDGDSLHSKALSLYLAPSNRLDLDSILANIEMGLAASATDNAGVAAKRLLNGMYYPLQRHGQAALRWMRHSTVAHHLLRGHVQLGHSLMNIGQWRAAEAVLLFTVRMLAELDCSEGGLDRDARVLGYSLWHDDLWLESMQYLGIVLRERDSRRAQGFLKMALSSLAEPSYFHREPTRPDSMRSNIERDLAVLLRHDLERGRRTDLSDIKGHLASAEASLRTPQSPGMQAAWLLERARLRQFAALDAQNGQRLEWVRLRDQIQGDIECAITLVQQDGSPMLTTKVLIDAIDMYGRLDIPVASERVLIAVNNCLKYQYGHQASKLIRLVRPDARLPDALVVPLRVLAELSTIE